MATLKLESFGHQNKFHDSKAKVRALVAGRGGGKTHAGATETVKQSLLLGRIGEHLVVAPTHQMAQDVCADKIQQILPEWAIRNWNKHELRLDLINGSHIQFLSGDKPDRIRGRGPLSMWVDEGRDIKRYAWDVIYTTSTRGKWCPIWITTTPNSYDWVHDEIYQRYMEGDPDYFVVHYKSNDNPFFDESDIERARRRLPEEFFRQEYEASFEMFTGRVYKDFSRATHVIEPFNVPEDWTVIRGIDFGYANPFAMVDIAIGPDGELYVFDEYYVSEQTLDIHAAYILTRRKANFTYGDPSGKQYMQDMKARGIHITPAENAVSAGIAKVAEYMRVDPVTEKPRFFVFKNCTNTIREIEKYHWQEAPRTDDTKEQPVKEVDHLCDAARYSIYTHFSKPRPGVYFG